MLHQFESFSADVEIAETLNFDYIIRVFVPVLFLCKFSVKTEALIAPWNEIPRSLTVGQCAARLIDLNGYVASFPGGAFTDNISVTELNEILLNIMHNSWSKQAYIQDFIVGLLLFKSLLICLIVWKLLSLFTKV